MAVAVSSKKSSSVQHELGCGLLGGMFPRRSFWLRKTPVHSLPIESSNNVQNTEETKKPTSTVNSIKPPPRRQRSKSETAFPDSSNLAKLSTNAESKHTRRHSLVTPISTQQKSENRRASDAARSSTSSTLSLAPIKVSKQTSESKSRKDPINVSNDQNSRIAATKQPDSDTKALVRSTSSNVMLAGHLGNLRLIKSGNILGNNSPSSTIRTIEYENKNLPEVNSMSHRPKNSVMGNIVRQSSAEFRQLRGAMTRMDHVALKNIGNEKYKQGMFEEALAFYDRAISLDPNQATYRCNKSAALMGLGRLMEAVSECEEAIRLDPCYQRPHQRLATLCVRLGEAEKALRHYQQSGSNWKDIDKVQELQKHLNRCSEARKSRDWNTLLKAAECALSYGAVSAPQVYAMQAEALLKLHRHEEAYTAYLKGPNFDIDACTKFFGLDITSHFLMIGALVYLAAGRFEDAVVAAQEAGGVDPSNIEVKRVLKSSKAVASARLSGNLLFKATRFSEACIAYSEGLEHNPYNAILLCNRAACRSKLGQFEKAVEDCTIALCVQPNYSKARLRRAHCNAKLERWEASIQDYEMLIRESSTDEEIGRALFEAQVQLKKQRGEDTKDLKFGSNLVFISSNERFRHHVTSPGMSVVLFCNKGNHKQVLHLMEPVRKRFPSVNFLKVEVEDHPYLAKSENVASLPSFKLYKNGSRVKEIPGNNPELLENSLQWYSS